MPIVTDSTASTWLKATAPSSTGETRRLGGAGKVGQHLRQLRKPMTEPSPDGGGRHHHQDSRGIGAHHPALSTPLGLHAPAEQLVVSRNSRRVKVTFRMGEGAATATASIGIARAAQPEERALTEASPLPPRAPPAAPPRARQPPVGPVRTSSWRGQAAAGIQDGRFRVNRAPTAEPFRGGDGRQGDDDLDTRLRLLHAQQRLRGGPSVVMSAAVTAIAYPPGRAGHPAQERTRHGEADRGPGDVDLLGKNTAAWTSRSTSRWRKPSVEESIFPPPDNRSRVISPSQSRRNSSRASTGRGVRRIAFSQAPPGATSARRPGSMARRPEPSTRSVSTSMSTLNV